MEQKTVFNPNFSSTSLIEENVLFTLRPSILAIWPVFLAIPMAVIFFLASYVLLTKAYDSWFSTPQMARDIAWSLASEGERNGFRLEMIYMIITIIGTICLISYIIVAFKSWKEKKIVLTNSHITYTNKSKSKTYSIHQIVSCTEDKGGFFKDISYLLNTNEVISVEYVKKSIVEAANNHIANYLNGNRNM